MIPLTDCQPPDLDVLSALADREDWLEQWDRYIADHGENTDPARDEWEENFSLRLHPRR